MFCFLSSESTGNNCFLAMISWQEIAIIAIVLIVLFGAKRIPELMRSLGIGIKEFKSGLSNMENKEKEENSESEKPGESKNSH